jgi:hypothetical protein
VPARDFVPVELLGQGVTRPQSASPAEVPADPQRLPVIAAEIDESWAERTSLFGDLDA